MHISDLFIFKYTSLKLFMLIKKTFFISMHIFIEAVWLKIETCAFESFDVFL